MTKTSWLKSATVFLALVLTPANAASADDGGTRKLIVDDYFKIKNVGNPIISPDSKWVVYRVSNKDLENDNSYSRLWIIPIAGGEARALTKRGESASNVTWSSDSKSLIFNAPTTDDGWQLHTLDIAEGSTPKQITYIKGGVDNFKLSPDGNRLLMSITDEDTGEPTIPWVVNDLVFKQDYVGYIKHLPTHLYVHTLSTGETIQITDGDTDEYSASWSPDGSLIAFTSNRTPEPFRNSNTDIWVVKSDVPAGAQEPIRITSNPGADGSPIWHPDGKQIAYLASHSERTDVPVSYLQTKIAIVGIEKKKPKLLTTKKLDRKAYGIKFSPEGDQIYAMLEDDGRVDMIAVSTDDGAMTRPITGQLAVWDIEVASNGSVIAAITKPRLPGELFVLDKNATAPRQLTNVNKDLLHEKWLSSVEEHRFATVDGTDIQTFIYKPQNFDPARKYPAILWLHGGQESQYDYGFNFRVQMYANDGYVVIMPNVRGSGGRGQKFALALNKAYGTADVEDAIAATDYAIDQGYVDPERLGVGGWSSGGTLTNFVIAKTQRFKGAISGASVGWYTSTYGHDPYYLWWHTELGAPWKNREIWDRISPFMYVENITTPTLFIGGEKDWNQPIIHSEQMYQAMKHLGQDAQLVVYPNAHHGIRRHTYQKDLLERFLAWFDKYVKNGNSGT